MHLRKLEHIVEPQPQTALGTAASTVLLPPLLDPQHMQVWAAWGLSVTITSTQDTPYILGLRFDSSRHIGISAKLNARARVTAAAALPEVHAPEARGAPHRATWAGSVGCSVAGGWSVGWQRVPCSVAGGARPRCPPARGAVRCAALCPSGPLPRRQAGARASTRPPTPPPPTHTRTHAGAAGGTAGGAAAGAGGAGGGRGPCAGGHADAGGGEHACAGGHAGAGGGGREGYPCPGRSSSGPQSTWRLR